MATFQFKKDERKIAHLSHLADHVSAFCRLIKIILLNSVSGKKNIVCCCKCVNLASYWLERRAPHHLRQTHMRSGHSS